MTENEVLRAAAAIGAMIGILADTEDLGRAPGMTCPESVAQLAVRQADLLIAELNRTKPNETT